MEISELYSRSSHSLRTSVVFVLGPVLLMTLFSFFLIDSLFFGKTVIRFIVIPYVLLYHEKDMDYLPFVQ